MTTTTIELHIADTWEEACAILEKRFKETFSGKIPKDLSDLHPVAYANALYESMRGSELMFRFLAPTKSHYETSVSIVVGAKRLVMEAPGVAAGDERDFLDRCCSVYKQSQKLCDAATKEMNRQKRARERLTEPRQ